MRKAKLTTTIDHGPTTKTALGSLVTVDQFARWNEYLGIFKERWGLDPYICEYIAICGGDLFEAEFAEHGTEAYGRSVTLPIRNAFYQMFMLPMRWANLREMGVADPVLDYGCGCGLLLNWLWTRDHHELYGLELPGVQRQIAERSFRGKDITMWDGVCPGRFNTVICLNVLEHVKDPLALLKRLYEVSNRVIADVCIDEEEHEQGPHIAPKDALRECADILREHGTLYTSEPHDKPKVRRYGT